MEPDPQVHQAPPNVQLAQPQEEMQLPQQQIQQPPQQSPQQQMPQPQQQFQPPRGSVVTTQPEKGSPPQVYPGGYPLPPYTHPYPGQAVPGYHMAPGMVPGMAPQMAHPVVNVPVMQPTMHMPAQQQTVTNVNVNTGDTKLMRDWKANLCACCKDPSGCMAGLFCLPCLVCWLSTRLDEPCMVPVFVPYALPALRLKFRTAQRIKGSICEDCMLSFCGLGQCVACQLKREYDMLGDPLNYKMQKIHAT